MKISFAEVSLIGTKSVKCSACGKTLKRQCKFLQTLNPWNRRPDGEPKDRHDIIHELNQAIKDWQQLPETCKKCESGAGAVTETAAEG